MTEKTVKAKRADKTKRTEKFNINLSKDEVTTAIQEYLRGHYGDEAQDIRISVPETLPVYYNKVAK